MTQFFRNRAPKPDDVCIEISDCEAGVEAALRQPTSDQELVHIEHLPLRQAIVLGEDVARKLATSVTVVDLRKAAVRQAAAEHRKAGRSI